VGGSLEAMRVVDAPEREEGSDAAEERLNRLLVVILQAAVDAVGFDAAAVTARRDGATPGTVAATDRTMTALDDAQYESGEGPCLDVLDPHEPIFVDDAAALGDRWELFSRTAQELGVHSTLSTHLPLDGTAVAASLNFYSREQLEHSAEQIRAATGFAEQLAAAIMAIDAYRTAARLAREMTDAMRSRAVIEQAKGIVAADRKISADAAFGHLVERSNRENRKLRDVAQQLVDERTAHEPPEPDG
jgi:GAF domain-containing protein